MNRPVKGRVGVAALVVAASKSMLIYNFFLFNMVYMQLAMVASASSAHCHVRLDFVEKNVKQSAPVMALSVTVTLVSV